MVGDVVGNVTDAVAGDVVGDAVSNVISKGAVVVTNKDVDTEGVIPGTVVKFAADLVSGLLADSDFRSDDLRLSLAPAPRFVAVLQLDFESMFVSSFESKGAPDFMPRFAPNLEADFEVVSAAAEWSLECSGAELDMDEASVALKLADDAGRVAVEAAGGAAGMRIASTCIGVPQVRLHSMSQWRGV